MPIWNDKPPSDSGSPGLRLIRTPWNKPLHAVSTSTNLVGCATHFVSNRTTPCEGSACEACAEGFPWRWHGYLAIVDLATWEHCLLEVTARAAESLTLFKERVGSLRGCELIASRVNNRFNGRVVIRTKPADLQKITLPPEPSIQKQLCHIWNLPQPTAAAAPCHNRPDLILVDGDGRGGRQHPPHKPD